MAKNKIIIGLDVGTSSIKALVVEKRNTEWNVLNLSQIPSFGLRRGAVMNVEEASRNIQLLMADVERKSGRKINSVFVNIGGNHLYTIPSDGLISVSRADHIISQEDVERVLQATRAINIPLNEEILDVFPEEFIIDGQKGIKQPLGLIGVRLEAKVILLCYFQSYFMNLSQAVLNSKLQIDDIIPSPLAASRAVLTPQQKEIGVALIDMGYSTTSLAVFEEGDLIHLAVLPLGSGNITNDIAIGLKTEVAVAEEIKKQHGSCLIYKTDKDITKTIFFKGFDSKKHGEAGESKRGRNVSKALQDIANEHLKEGMVDEENMKEKMNSLSFTKKDLVDIIEPRVSEILDLMQKELKKIGRQELLPGGVVLTGGGVKLPRIKDLVKDQLKLTCQIGNPHGIVGLPEDPSLATAAGLMLSGADLESFNPKGLLNFGALKGWSSKFRKMFRVFIP